MADPGNRVRVPGGPGVRTKKAAIEAPYAPPPDGSGVVCLGEMGPEAAKSVPGTQAIDPAPTADRPAARAKHAADYGRRGKGYVFGAFRPATGEALTRPYPARIGANRIGFLERVERWLPAGATRVYAVLDDLAAHASRDVLLFNPAYPRWGFAFRPVAAADPNLIEPWWKVLRSLALKGRRFETRDQIAAAVDPATAYRNAHRHPFRWGRRRRHRPRRVGGFATPPPAR